MDKWLKSIRNKQNKRAIPILTFPAIQLMNKTVEEVVKSSDLQVEALKLIYDRCHPLAITGFMDLSVEAEAFGSQIQFSQYEVPNVLESIVNNEEDAIHLRIPEVGEKRTGIYIETIKKMKEQINDCPIFAGCIGPFSLAGRLLDVTEAMIYCYDEPDMVHMVLDKVTSFLIDYIKAYKDVGADGIFMAEPLAGILSPSLCDEFSSQYVKRIVEALDDENFVVIYHNCGNNTLKMTESLLSTGCRAFHFGNAISIEEMLKKMPNDVLIMGNLDPVHLKDKTKEEIVEETTDLLEKVGNIENFIISSGCDIPPLSSWENIDTFMKISQEFYQDENNS